VIDGAFTVCGEEVIAVPIKHGERTILGYRVGGFAYLTDCSGIPESSRALLKELEVLVLDGLRHEPHPTHFNITQALAAIDEIKPRRAFLTHLTHDIDHAAVEATLPENVRLAYDGLEIEVNRPEAGIVNSK